MSQENILGFYGHDHDVLDNYFKEFQTLKNQDYARARASFRAFKFGLQRHILWEDQILFPVFETRTGMKDRGPTAVMRQEHILIKEALEALHQKVRRNDPDSGNEEEALIDLLSRHNQKEEGVLYPAIDQLMTAEEKKSLFKQMQDVPKEEYASCGCKHH
ncbi:MAG: hemerythrin domain-containing protein [Candidatus Omnitrophica bacterium]|nr:hemerythrin domain-containing protein [Candidatus Omnitrophota bacterium]MDE2213597.1 hemerythrin domain-containing protein [Candidatus Omnitrophota bacterium]MDE2230502.1 hemerythrin domain-containing protein [Candidatus Omnitrophota bacterium]